MPRNEKTAYDFILVLRLGQKSWGYPCQSHRRQELRTVKMCSLLDELGHGIIDEVAFKRAPAFDLAAPALDFQLDERAQGTKEMVADGLLAAHEEALGVAELFDRTMVALDAPMLAVDVVKRTQGNFQALFFRESKAASGLTPLF